MVVLGGVLNAEHNLNIWIEAFDSNALEVTVCVKEEFVHSPCLERGTTQETSTAIIGCGTPLYFPELSITGLD